MTTLTRLLGPLLLVTITACASGGTGTVRDDSPPPHHFERVEYRPGYVWIEGHWHHRGQQWQWTPGTYERERPGFVYIEGRWRDDGARHTWVDGQWRPGGGVVIRDHH